MKNKAPVLMIQGTGSHVGKSWVTAALCRYYVNQGLRVAPFKAQNMANNSTVCADGGEIGRAQAVQAQACKIEPTVDMNPILIKPETDKTAQIVFMGKPVKTMGIGEYKTYKEEAWPIVCAALDRLREQYDLVIAEGAGSPAEINLKDQDIVNMKVAEYADAQVLLVGDIDMGGVFAQFVGTLELLEPKERDRIAGFIVNKFRGDLELLKPGLTFLEEKTGKPVLGVLPFIHDHGIAEEDALPHEHRGQIKKNEKASVLIDVIRFPRISNFTDFDPLQNDPRVELRYLTRPPQDRLFPDLLLLPGTKNTIGDLEFLEASGLADYVKSVAEAGKWVWGICGGFQMLGNEIQDPEKVEGSRFSAKGLGLLPHSTTFKKTKTTTQVKGFHVQSGLPIQGYEIHMGDSSNGTKAKPLFQITERLGQPVQATDGLQSDNIFGTYLHGLFDNPPFCEWLIQEILKKKDLAAETPKEKISHQKDDPYDRLASQIAQSLTPPGINSHLNRQIKR